jgi:hypothetical protein
MKAAIYGRVSTMGKGQDVDLQRVYPGVERHYSL